MTGSSTVPAARRDCAASGARRETVVPGWMPPPGWIESAESGLVSFVSRPCDWTAEQLRDAALQVLQVQAAALRGGSTLARVSADSVQFHGSRPVWADPAAFAAREGGPWPAYADFCRAYLTPLALAAHHLPGGEEALTLRQASRRLPLASFLMPGALRQDRKSVV